MAHDMAATRARSRSRSAARGARGGGLDKAGFLALMQRGNYAECRRRADEMNEFIRLRADKETILATLALLQQQVPYVVFLEGANIINNPVFMEDPDIVLATVQYNGYTL